MAESEVSIQEFHDGDRYRSAHDAYIRWLRRNPRGYVLNRKALTYAVLHESDCMHIANYDDPKVSLTEKPKICAPKRSEPLKAWAKERGINWSRCDTCFG